MIWLYSDYLGKVGGIETYLHALATKLLDEGVAVRIAVCEMEPCAMLDDLEALGLDIYRQTRVCGDRWRLSQRLLSRWVSRRLEADDLVFCVRVPMEETYENLVKRTHAKGAKIAVSWPFTPDALPVQEKFHASFCRAIEATDHVISVSETGVPMYKTEYGYQGKVDVLRYHNLRLFPQALPLLDSPPWKLGFIGRIDEKHKNIEAIIEAFGELQQEFDVELHFHGGGPDLERMERFAQQASLGEKVKFHGAYDHKRDLGEILKALHLVIYTSNYEGGPCFSLLEAAQAGRFVIATRVGGIPDLYQNHRDAGLLIDNPSRQAIKNGFVAAISKFESEGIDTKGPLNRYNEEFTIEHAHETFKRLFLEAS